MANRWFNQFGKTLEKEVVHLFGNAAIGATGAPTLDSSNDSKGVSTLVRNSAGNYTLTLQDPYYKFLDFSVVFENGGTLAAAPVVDLQTISVGTSTGGTVRFVCRNYSGTATDPDNGSTMYFHLVVGNSSAY